MTDHTRREVLKSGGVLASSSVGVVGFEGTTMASELTPAAVRYLSAEAGLNLSRRSFDADVKLYDGNPSWNLKIDADSVDALRDWADESDDRQIIRELSEHGLATVSAPADDLGHRALESGLPDESWVDRVDVNATVSLIEPVHLPGDKNTDWPSYSRLQSAFVGLGQDAPGTSGVAFEAEQTSTFADVRDVIGTSGLSQTGDGVTIAVIDTGLTYDSDIFGREVDEDGETVMEPRVLDASTDFTTDGDPTVGDEGLDVVSGSEMHGDWVAARIASSATDPDYASLGQDADLLVYRALDEDGGEVADIAASVHAAVDDGADVICMSLGSPIHSADIADALERAHENDILPVVAAGNDRYATRFAAYPASDPHTIAVSATTTHAPEDAESAFFANVGPAPGTQDFSEGATAGEPVEIAAPGMDIQAEIDGGLETLSGTSMAAPSIAEALVALLEADPGLDAEEQCERLLETAAPAPNLAAAESEAGLVDAAAAVNDDPPEDEQADVMTDSAEARDAWYRAESDARGGLVAQYVF